MQYIKGDLIKAAKSGKVDVIIHQANCFCLMGAGIARIIADEFPEMYKVDQETIVGDITKFGSFSYAYMNKYNLHGFNAYGQYRTGRSTDYDQLKSSLLQINKYIDDNIDDKNIRIGLPMLGCGIGGGDWNVVDQIIKDVFKDKYVFVYQL